MNKNIVFLQAIFCTALAFGIPQEINIPKIAPLKEAIEKTDLKKVQELVLTIKLTESEKLFLFDIAQGSIGILFIRMQRTKELHGEEVPLAPLLAGAISSIFLILSLKTENGIKKKPLLIGLIGGICSLWWLAVKTEANYKALEKLYEDSLKIKQYFL